MEKLQTPSKTEVLHAFRQADDKGKEMLQSLFGKIEPENITEKVLTLEDAYEVLGIDDENSEELFMEKHFKSVEAYRKLIVITAALNEGWEPDWEDDNQQKFYPWFYMSGFRLDDVSCGCGYSDVGSRLCFRDSSLAEYAAKQFESLYKEFMLIEN